MTFSGPALFERKQEFSAAPVFLGISGTPDRTLDGACFYPSSIKLWTIISWPSLLKAEVQDKLCQADYTPLTVNLKENKPVRHSSAVGINGQNERHRSAGVAH
ncbi:hypothetical protein ACVI1L_004821 [Bradyrhizobium sp. USDA 4516]